MPLDLGDRYSGCTLYGSFTTVDTTPVPTGITGRPGNKSAGNCFVVVWKTNSDPWSCSLAGVTEAFDCNGALGWNTFSVNTNASPTFYSCGKDYIVMLHGGTVGGNCVSYYTLATFSLKNRAGLNPTVHGLTIDLPVPTASAIACTTWNQLRSAYGTCGTFGYLVDCAVSAAVQPTTPGTRIDLPLATQSQVACTIWNQLKNAYGTCGTFGDLLDAKVSSVGGSSLTVGAIACTVWDELKSGHDTCGTFGNLLDCKTSTALQPTVPLRRLDVTVTGEAGIDWANIGSPLTIQHLDCTNIFQVHSVCNTVTTSGGTAPTSGEIACVVWNQSKAAYGTCGTFGFLLDCSVRTAASTGRLTATGIDDILDEAITEPASVFAWANATLRNIVGWVGAVTSNQIRQSASQQGLCDRAATLRIALSEVSCSLGVVTRGSFT